MFSSRFSQNLFAYFRQPKKYIVSVRLRIDGWWYDRDVEVISYAKKDAQKMAIEKTLNDINLSVNGLKSLGRVKDNLKIKEK